MTLQYLHHLFCFNKIYDRIWGYLYPIDFLKRKKEEQQQRKI